MRFYLKNKQFLVSLLLIILFAFGATLTDPAGQEVKLEVELKEFNQQFNGQDTIISNFVQSGNKASITRYGLIVGEYHWRARAINESGGVSSWREFGIAGNMDFIIKKLTDKAVELAKELINEPYLWGGKGWEYDQKLFVSPGVIKTGYRYWNSDDSTVSVGIGVDCSGLVLWAYDRSFDPSKNRFNNFLVGAGADEQYRPANKNTEPIEESELQPGDVMFFDWDSNGYIDHVAMYVGESGGYDVVNAENPIRGIVARSKDALKTQSGFVAFKRVISAISPAILASSYSPVDLIVTDPDGFTITPTTIISSDEEYLREIPGTLYYSEMEKGEDGNPIDRVYSYIRKTGDYTIKVLPDSAASPTATYTLDFQAGDQLITLAQDVPLNQIPQNGYGVAVSSMGVVESFIPISIDIKPGSSPNSINIGSKGVTPVAILSNQSFNIKNVTTDSLVFAGAKPIKSNYEDVNGDGNLDMVLHFNTQSLQLTSSDTKAILTGQLTDGRMIKGVDSVRIITNKRSFLSNLLASIYELLF